MKFINESVFSAGEQHLVIPESILKEKQCELTINWKSPSDTMKILLISEVFKRNKVSSSLILPYLPYSRQDRVTERNVPFSLKVFAELINSCGFNSVKTFDTHSNVSEILINNLVNIKPTRFLERILMQEDVSIIIAPDAGAYKKVYDTISGLPEDMKSRLDVVCANKVRCVKTGEIIKTEIDTRNIKGKNCLVLDDICDGGRTFVELSKVCEGVESLSLAVTHGIFSKGLKELNKYYSSIICANNMSNEVLQTINYQ